MSWDSSVKKNVPSLTRKVWYLQNLEFIQKRRKPFFSLSLYLPVFRVRVIAPVCSNGADGMGCFCLFLGSFAFWLFFFSNIVNQRAFIGPMGFCQLVWCVCARVHVCVFSFNCSGCLSLASENLFLLASRILTPSVGLIASLILATLVFSIPAAILPRSPNTFCGGQWSEPTVWMPVMAFVSRAHTTTETQC